MVSNKKYMCRWCYVAKSPPSQIDACVVLAAWRALRLVPPPIPYAWLLGLVVECTKVIECQKRIILSQYH